MPIRFESPSLGGRGDAPLGARKFQTGISYRRLTADEFFVGRERDDSRGPGGQPLDFNVNSFTLSAAYAITERFGVSVHIPWSTGESSRLYADGARHTTAASGLGDIRVVATRWMWEPMYIPRGNMALGIGVKSATGTHTATDYNWTATGDSTRAPVDQAIQLGDGGWGIVLQAEGFRRIRDGTFIYASADYLATLAEKTKVASPRSPTQMLGVPDVYNVRAGISSVVFPALGVTASLGMRQDATTRSDLIGGKDLYFRRPAIVGYVDPALSVTRGKSSYFVNTPVRAYQNFRLDHSFKPGDRANGGDLARYLLFMGYTRRW